MYRILNVLINILFIYRACFDKWSKLILFIISWDKLMFMIFQKDFVGETVSSHGCQKELCYL